MLFAVIKVAHLIIKISRMFTTYKCKADKQINNKFMSVWTHKLYLSSRLRTLKRYKNKFWKNSAMSYHNKSRYKNT